MNKKLEKKIAKKLTVLESIIEEIRNIDINSDDPEMWDPDYYYDLAENLKLALKLLENKKANTKDQYGDPIVLEVGILTLLEEYHSEEEENEEDE